VIALLAVPALAAGLGFHWSDGRPLAVRGTVYVWCGKWDDGFDVRTLRIQQGSPFAPPWWSIEVRVALADRGRRITFPTLSGRSASMFAGYPRKQLEASSDKELSRGSLTILDDVSCRPRSRVRVKVSVHLAAEESGGPSVDVAGTFTGVVGTRPAPGVQP